MLHSLIVLCESRIATCEVDEVDEQTIVNSLQPLSSTQVWPLGFFTFEDKDGLLSVMFSHGVR
jgi:hypothetical protein